MEDGLRFNHVKYGKLCQEKPALSGVGVDFFDARSELQPHEMEAATWLDAIEYDKDPITKPEEAYVVTRILEAIYESAKTGETIYFD